MQQLIEFAGNHALLAAGFVGVIGMIIWSELSRLNRGYLELTPSQAVRKINAGNTSIVDISAASDFSKGHLAGAKHVALSRFSKPDPEIEKLKDDALLVVCKNGQTAHQAATRLVKLGASDVAVLKGGTVQWKADQFPLSKK